jgi:AraC-like DNA-binding protein
LSVPETPQHHLLRTTDVDEARSYCAGVYDYPMRMRLAGRGEGFAFAAQAVGLGPVTLGDVGYGADIRLDTDDLTTAYHVLMPVTGGIGTRQGKIAVGASPRTAALFRPEGGVELTWPGDTRLISIKIDRLALERELGAPPPPTATGIDLVTGPGRSWAAMIRLLTAELDDPLSLTRHPTMTRHWWQLVVGGLAMVLDLPRRDEPMRTTTPLRPRTVKRALDAMHADPGYPFTVAELAAVAEVGPRVLQDAFRRYVGVPPLTYLRRLRLARAHEELRRSDPQRTSVGEIAYRWGFTHLGRFAGVYRAQYGVSPSRTLYDRP